MLRFWVLVLGSWLASVPAGGQSRRDYRILSCDAPFTPIMTAKSLMDAFGAPNVTFEDIHVGEGHMEIGIVLFSKSSEDRLEILMTGDVENGAPRHIVLRAPKTRWRTKGGLTIGTSLQSTERLNRRPFRLLGFGWDYGGTVMEWSKGLLDNAADGPCTIRARFAPVQNDLGQYVNGTEKYVSQVGGEREFSSGHPAMQALNPVIYEIFIQYR